MQHNDRLSAKHLVNQRVWNVTKLVHRSVQTGLEDYSAETEDDWVIDSVVNTWLCFGLSVDLCCIKKIIQCKECIVQIEVPHFSTEGGDNAAPEAEQQVSAMQKSMQR